MSAAVQSYYSSLFVFLFHAITKKLCDCAFVLECRTKQFWFVCASERERERERRKRPAVCAGGVGIAARRPFDRNGARRVESTAWHLITDEAFPQGAELHARSRVAECRRRAKRFQERFGRTARFRPRVRLDKRTSARSGGKKLRGGEWTQLVGESSGQNNHLKSHPVASASMADALALLAAKKGCRLPPNLKECIRMQKTSGKYSYAVISWRGYLLYVSRTFTSRRETNVVCTSLL